MQQPERCLAMRSHPCRSGSLAGASCALVSLVSCPTGARAGLARRDADAGPYLDHQL